MDGFVVTLGADLGVTLGVDCGDGVGVGLGIGLGDVGRGGGVDDFNSAVVATDSTASAVVAGGDVVVASVGSVAVVE